LQTGRRNTFIASASRTRLLDCATGSRRRRIRKGTGLAGATMEAWMREFLVRHWSELESRDDGPAHRRAVLERACRSLMDPPTATLPASLTRLLGLLEAQTPSLPPLQFVAIEEVEEEEVEQEKEKEQAREERAAAAALLDVEFLLTVCDDVLALLREARSAQRAAMVAELATSGEVLESLHAGLATMEQLFAYADLLAELRGAALVRRAQLLLSAMRK
jgi:hypothetical protein